ncbi:MAG: large subunit ribosomal protein L13 [Limisphaerales bacterium]|jgi:large subunit ribosomal protein L13
MDSKSYRTQFANEATVKREWFIVDAEGQTLGRMCSEIATVLRGKHKATYTPHFDAGDYVIVINAEKVRLTGKKMTDKKYMSHSGYPGGQKEITPVELLAKRPHQVVEKAVKGMLPHNTLGRDMYRKLFVYAGTDHKHQAQQPKTLNIKG